MTTEERFLSASDPLPADPANPSATEERAPYLTGAQEAAAPSERDADPITAAAFPSGTVDFPSCAGVPLSPVTASRESLWSLLSVRGLTVSVPPLQREYAQGRPDADAEAIRRKLVSDLFDGLRKAVDPDEADPGVDLGFLYGNLEENGRFIPIDGQQRLTTLFLLHWLLALQSGRLAQDSDVRRVLLRFHYDGRETVDRFCRLLVLEPPDGSGLGPEIGRISSRIRSCAWFRSGWEQNPSVQGMLVMLDSLQEELTGLIDAGFMAERLFSLLISPQLPVSFLFLNLDDAGLSDSTYVRMNARGRPLTFFEGFKARLPSFLDPDAEDGREPFADPFLRQLNGPWTALFWMPEYRERRPNPTTDRPMLRFFRFMILTDYIVNTKTVSGRAAICRALKTLMGEPDEAFFSRLFRDSFRTVDEVRSGQPPVTIRTFQKIRQLLDLLTLRKKETGSVAFLRRFGSPETFFEEESAFRRLIGTADGPESGYRELLLLFAEYRFLLRHARPDRSFRHSAALARWLRLISNLSDSVQNPQADAFFGMIRAVDRLVESGFALHSRNALLCWPRLPSALSVFPASQLAEEAVKAVLLQSGSRWRKAVLEAERSFLNGRIDLLFTYAGIRAEDVFSASSAPTAPADGGPEYLSLMRCLRRFQLLFDRNGVRPELEDDTLLQRALLCYGGEDSFLLPVGRNRRCFPDNTDGDLGFRRLLRDECGGRRAFLLQLLDDLDETAPVRPQLRRILSCKSFSGGEEWKEFFVTMPEILSSVRLRGPDAADPMGEWVFQTEKRMIRMNHPDDILLLSRTQTSSVSREYYTYVLFLKARQRGLPVYYHADYTESAEKYAWFTRPDSVQIRILYRNPDNTHWRFIAFPEECSVPVCDGTMEKMLDYIRESSEEIRGVSD